VVAVIKGPINPSTSPNPRLIFHGTHFWYVMVLHLLDLVTTTSLLEPLEKFTEWERFHSLATNVISPRIEINSGVEPDKAAGEFTASIASAYRLPTNKIILVQIECKNTRRG
jgi:hypothetical protein